MLGGHLHLGVTPWALPPWSPIQCRGGPLPGGLVCQCGRVTVRGGLWGLRTVGFGCAAFRECDWPFCC